jgi:hypothetical protein
MVETGIDFKGVRAFKCILERKVNILVMRDIEQKA